MGPPDLTTILLTGSIALVQLMCASILAAHWKEIVRCRERLHSVEGNQNVLHGVLQAKGIIPGGMRQGQD